LSGPYFAFAALCRQPDVVPPRRPFWLRPSRK